MIRPCYEIIEEKLKGEDCILAFETAADYLGICCGTHQRPKFYVYATEDLGLDDVECTVVSSFNGIDYVCDRGMQCTSVQQTIIDLLRANRDDQVICESLADWYFSHGDSFDDLDLPDDVVPLFLSYCDDAITYYDN